MTKIDYCDGNRYTNQPAKYIDHLITSHGADPRVLEPIRTRTDAFLWGDVNEIHKALLVDAGLDERLNQGYCVDQWWLWQNGMCRTYATGLTLARQDLRLGVAGWDTHDGDGAVDGWWARHWFAHDDEFAYDSAGRHPLPYRGVEQDFDHIELDTDPEAWGELSIEEGSDFLDLVDAVRHSVRNGILIGWYERIETAGLISASF